MACYFGNKKYRSLQLIPTEKELIQGMVSFLKWRQRPVKVQTWMTLTPSPSRGRRWARCQDEAGGGSAQRGRGHPWSGPQCPRVPWAHTPSMAFTRCPPLLSNLLLCFLYLDPFLAILSLIVSLCLFFYWSIIALQRCVRSAALRHESARCAQTPPPARPSSRICLASPPGHHRAPS